MLIVVIIHIYCLSKKIKSCFESLNTDIITQNELPKDEDTDKKVSRSEIIQHVY